MTCFRDAVYAAGFDHPKLPGISPTNLSILADIGFTVPENCAIDGDSLLPGIVFYRNNGNTCHCEYYDSISKVFESERKRVVLIAFPPGVKPPLTEYRL
jgi:hypothetical protein